MFDPYLSSREFLVTGGLLRAREVGGRDDVGGFGVALGESLLTRRQGLFVRARVEYGFQMVGGRHAIVGLATYAYGAGLGIGPVELEARVALTALDIHLGADQWGFGFFSPRVGAAASVQIGTLRVGAMVFSEYCWRWVGGPDVRVFGLALDLGFLRPPIPLPARYAVP